MNAKFAQIQTQSVHLGWFPWGHLITGLAMFLCSKSLNFESASELQIDV